MMLFKLENIKYKIANKIILNGCTISIKKSEHLLIHGASGCGKTTLINLMAGLLKPSSGEIIFDNKTYSSLSEKALDQIRAENFGFIFQKLHLIGHLNVEQNIVIANSKLNVKRNDELINNLGLSQKRKQKVHDLSVGEAQRVAIARGVVNNPKVIFADEPTSSLDYKNCEKVMDLIFQQAKETKTSLIVSSHDKRIKGMFTNILEMK